MLAQQRGLRGGLGRQRPLATPLRGMRVTPPVHAGPLIAGLGVALVAYGTKLLMQATRNRKFQEAMCRTGAAEGKSGVVAMAAPERSQDAVARSASFSFTTGTMGASLGGGSSSWSGACCAIWDRAGEGSVRVVENEQGGRTTPAVVAFGDSGKALVGLHAKRLLFSKSSVAVCGHQLLLGVAYDSAERRAFEKMGALGSLMLVPTPDGAAAVDVRSVRHTPAELLARTIAQLKADAEVAHGGRAVSSAVLSIPAGSDIAARAAMEAAGRAAGLSHLELIEAPVAAAIAAAVELAPVLDCARRLAVFEWCGRAISVAVLVRRVGVDAPSPTRAEAWEIEASSRRIIGGDGIGGFGSVGEPLESVLVAHLAENFRQEHGIELRGDHLAMARLFEAAEAAKLELSATYEAKISLPYITANADGPKHLQTTLSRARFEALAEPLLHEVLAVCEDVEATLVGGDTLIACDALLLVGGHARLPALIKRLTCRFGGRVPLSCARPDETLAFGAATHAQALQAL